MLKRITVLAMLAAIGIVASPAAAQQYPNAQRTITISDTTVVPGQQVAVASEGWLPNSPVDHTMFSAPVPLGVVNANAEGKALIVFVVPTNTTVGSHQVVASGKAANNTDLSLTVNFTVVAQDATAIPRTGDDSSLPLARIGLGLVAAGGLAVFGARRRRLARVAA